MLTVASQSHPLEMSFTPCRSVHQPVSLSDCIILFCTLRTFVCLCFEHRHFFTTLSVFDLVLFFALPVFLCCLCFRPCMRVWALVTAYIYTLSPVTRINVWFSYPFNKDNPKSAGALVNNSVLRVQCATTTRAAEGVSWRVMMT